MWDESEMIHWREKKFEATDLEQACIVVAATNDPDINMLVYQSIRAEQWINIVNRPELCSFIVPAVVRKGDLTIAISTQGNYPGLAKKLRGELEEWVGDEYNEYISFLGDMRRKILKMPLDQEMKLEMLKALLDERFREWTLKGEYDKREQAIRDILSS